VEHLLSQSPLGQAPGLAHILLEEAGNPFWGKHSSLFFLFIYSLVYYFLARSEKVKAPFEPISSRAGSRPCPYIIIPGKGFLGTNTLAYLASPLVTRAAYSIICEKSQNNHLAHVLLDQAGKAFWGQTLAYLSSTSVSQKAS
jgi:hypothetical protein